MQDSNKTKENKKAILKSTALLGGSSFINILIGMIKTKIVALLLGPSGVGFMGVISSLQQIVTTVTGLGLNTSGVRQIAHATASNDEKKVALTVKSLRITVWATGALGLLFMVFSARLLSQLSFKTEEYSVPIAVLGLAVLFSAISSGQTCVLQGFRRIKDVAKISVIGAINGTIIGLPCYYFWGQNGIVPSMVLASLASLATSWWYVKKIQLVEVPISYPVIKKEAEKIIKLGLPLMLSAFVTTAVSYITRVFLSREAGLDAVGQYQAAFALAGVLVNFVLTAMGTDYYPRLTAVANDNHKMNEEVNSQTEIALLLAVPAITATIVFMPFVISLFYSSRFDGAIPILRWAVFGILGRVISWPLAYIILAKAKGGLFLFTEFISGIVNVLALIICYKYLGLAGSGLAFALLYIWYTGLMLIVAKKISRFYWNKQNIALIIISLLVVTSLSIFQIFSIVYLVKYILGIILLIGISYIYIKRLFTISGISLKILNDKIIRS